MSLFVTIATSAAITLLSLTSISHTRQLKHLHNSNAKLEQRLSKIQSDIYLITKKFDQHCKSPSAHENLKLQIDSLRNIVINETGDMEVEDKAPFRVIQLNKKPE